MVNFEQLSEQDFNTYLERLISEYAEDKVKSGNWPPSDALQRSRQAFRDLLPDGVHTSGHSLFAVVDANSGEKVGLVWFGRVEQALEPFAFIYEIFINEDMRGRGYGTQTMRLLEEKVAEMGLNRISLHVFGHNQGAFRLYQKLGYEITNISMSKKV